MKYPQIIVRCSKELKGKAEKRAKRLGLDKSKYVRRLIERDLNGYK